MPAEPAAAGRERADRWSTACRSMVREAAAAGAGPTGPGWVIQLKGYHFHNTNPGLHFTNDEGKEFIENTFFKHLEEGIVQLPDGPDGEPVEVTDRQAGHPVPGRDHREPDHRRHYLPEAVGGETGQPVMNRMPEAGGVAVRRRARGPEDLEAAPLRFHDSVLLESDAAHGAAG